MHGCARYLKLVVREFAVNLDMDFIAALSDTLTVSNSSDDEDFDKIRANLLTDMRLVDVNAFADVHLRTTADTRQLFDYVHISPLVVRQQ